MSKKLLTLAVGAAMAAAPAMSAFADVTLYGRVMAEYNDTDSDFASSSDFDVSVDDDAGTSRWGIKATEKLANGLTAIAVLERKFDPADGQGADTDTARQNWVGLKGDFGLVAIGRFNSAYKTAGGVKYDPFVGTSLQARGAGGMMGGAFGQASFVTNAIAYKSPNYSGITAGATYSPDESAGTDGDYTANVKYSGAGFEVGLAVSNDENDIPGGGGVDGDATKVHGSYTFGDFTVNAQYEDVDGAPAGSMFIDGGDMWFIGGQWKWGNNVVVAQFGQADADSGITGVGSTETDYYAIGLIHKMSKQTRIFGGIANTDVDGPGSSSSSDGEIDTISIGLRKDF